MEPTDSYFHLMFTCFMYIVQRSPSELHLLLTPSFYYLYLRSFVTPISYFLLVLPHITRSCTSRLQSYPSAVARWQWPAKHTITLQAFSLLHFGPGKPLKSFEEKQQKHLSNPIYSHCCSCCSCCTKRWFKSNESTTKQKHELQKQLL